MIIFFIFGLEDWHSDGIAVEQTKNLDGMGNNY
jgi:hypothetical protein